MDLRNQRGVKCGLATVSLPGTPLTFSSVPAKQTTADICDMISAPVHAMHAYQITEMNNRMQTLLFLSLYGFF